MKKRRILKKEYNELIRELNLEKRWVSMRLGEVQTMHERAVSALKKENERLRERMIAMEEGLGIFKSPPDFRPRHAVCAFALDKDIADHLPFFRIALEHVPRMDFSTNPEYYRFNLEIDERELPLDREQARCIHEAINKLMQYLCETTQQQTTQGKESK